MSDSFTISREVIENCIEVELGWLHETEQRRGQVITTSEEATAAGG